MGSIHIYCERQHEGLSSDPEKREEKVSTLHGLYEIYNTVVKA